MDDELVKIIWALTNLGVEVSFSQNTRERFLLITMIDDENHSAFKKIPAGDLQNMQAKIIRHSLIDMYDELKNRVTPNA